MPSMDWDAFCRSHHRPYMIQSQQRAGAPRVRFDALHRFIDSMGLIGDFSVFQDNDCLRAALELEADAVRVARALGAKALGRRDEWAGLWLLHADWVTEEWITARTTLLQPSTRSQTRLKHYLRRRLRRLGIAHRTVGAASPTESAPDWRSVVLAA